MIKLIKHLKWTKHQIIRQRVKKLDDTLNSHINSLNEINQKYGTLFNLLVTIFDEKELKKQISVIKSKVIKNEAHKDQKRLLKLDKLLRKFKQKNDNAKVTIQNFSKTQIPENIVKTLELGLTNPIGGAPTKTPH